MPTLDVEGGRLHYHEQGSGETVVMTSYLSEGMCSLRVGKEDFSSGCPSTDDGFESHEDALTPTTEGVQAPVEFALRPVLGTAVITTTPLNAAVSLNAALPASSMASNGLRSAVTHMCMMFQLS